MRVLFVATNPGETARIAVGEEHRRIDRALRDGRDGVEHELLVEHELRASEVADVLLRRRPDVLHFCGHGVDGGAIILVGADGKEHHVAPDALARLLGALAGRLRIACAVLNACYSDGMARALAAHIDCVVGLPDAVDDTTAVAYAGAFYTHLARGDDVGTAHELGVAQARLEVPHGATFPTLHPRGGVDPRQVRPGAPGASGPRLPRVSGLQRGAEEGVFVWDGGRALGVEFVFVPPGMSEAKGFYLQRHPTRVQEFARFVRETGYVTSAERGALAQTWRHPAVTPQRDDHPVVCVSWHDAKQWAAWAGLELPTEAEWQRAALGEGNDPYPWGAEPPDDRRLWWSGATRRAGACAVGAHPAGRSWCGAHDLAGNVWEWTADPWSAAGGARRVIRGGGWAEREARRVGAAFRWAADAHTAADDLGFRCVLRG